MVLYASAMLLLLFCVLWLFARGLWTASGQTSFQDAVAWWCVARLRFLRQRHAVRSRTLTSGAEAIVDRCKARLCQDGLKFRKVEPRSRTRSGRQRSMCPTRIRKSAASGHWIARRCWSVLSVLSVLSAARSMCRPQIVSEKEGQPVFADPLCVMLMSCLAVLQVHPGHLAGVLQLRDKAASAAFAAVSGPILHKARRQIGLQGRSFLQLPMLAVCPFSFSCFERGA